MTLEIFGSEETTNFVGRGENALWERTSEPGQKGKKNLHRNNGDEIVNK